MPPIFACFFGASGSRPRSPPRPAPPPPSPTFREPWRNIRWGSTREDLQLLQNYKPENERVNNLRILVYGPIGSGKSSFINSIMTVMTGRVTTRALANAHSSNVSFTKKFNLYQIPKGKGDNKTHYPIVLCDIMGLEEDTGHGVRAEDIVLMLRGHVREGYQFNPVTPLSSDNPYYNPNPSPEDRVHVLVFVVSANMTQIGSSHLQKMANIREAASNLGIPQVAILTTVDEACPITKKDLTNVYRSKHLKNKLGQYSSSTGIPQNCNFLVKNYSDEIDMDNKVDALILSVLRSIVNFGDDFIETL